jgi:thioredoxin-like negative regulator of GroEL
MNKIIQCLILYALIVITPTIMACPHDPSSIVEITSIEHHQNFLNNHQGPCVVLYHMTNCIYCEKIKPIFQKMPGMFDHVTFYMVNGPEINAEQDVRIDGYPTMLFLNHGQIVDTQIGAAPENVIIQKLNDLDSATKPQAKKRSGNRSK